MRQPILDDDRLAKFAALNDILYVDMKIGERVAVGQFILLRTANLPCALLDLADEDHLIAFAISQAKQMASQPLLTIITRQKNIQRTSLGQIPRKNYLILEIPHDGAVLKNLDARIGFDPALVSPAMQSGLELNITIGLAPDATRGLDFANGSPGTMMRAFLGYRGFRQGGF